MRFLRDMGQECCHGASTQVAHLSCPCRETLVQDLETVTKPCFHLVEAGCVGAGQCASDCRVQVMTGCSGWWALKGRWRRGPRAVAPRSFCWCSDRLPGLQSSSDGVHLRLSCLQSLIDGVHLGLESGDSLEDRV